LEIFFYLVCFPPIRPIVSFLFLNYSTGFISLNYRESCFWTKAKEEEEKWRPVTGMGPEVQPEAVVSTLPAAAEVDSSRPLWN
jgi:hypothetical protein